MAVFTYTQIDALLGTLSNGFKIVQSVVTVTSVDTDATVIYPGGSTNSTTGGALSKVIAFVPSFRTAWTNAQVKFSLSSSTPGGITVDPAASLNAKIFEILAVGV